VPSSGAAGTVLSFFFMVKTDVRFYVFVFRYIRRFFR